jgi:hypothetical protein
MKGLIAVLLLLCLSACDSASTLKNGLVQSQAVAAELERHMGSKPQVGFAWNNGALTQVTVTFDGIPQEQNLQQITARASSAIRKHFKQTPQRVIVAFAITASEH